MKRLKLFFVIVIYYCPFSMLAQPTFYIEEDWTFEGLSNCIDLRTTDFTALIEVDLDLTWNPDLLTFTELKDETTNQLISFTQGPDRINLNLLSDDPLTLDDDSVLAQLCFQASNNCNQVAPVKFIDVDSAKIIRALDGGIEINIGFFPRDGGLEIACNSTSDFRDTLITRTICDGDEFDGYTQSGSYQDTIVINGENYIRTLELQMVSFESLICPEPDTFYIPEGFTHISLANEFIRPEVRASQCWALVQEEITGQTVSGNNILEFGTTNFDYTFQNPITTESCNYNIQVKQGELGEEYMTLSMPDTSIGQSEMLCLDITVESVDALIAYFHILNWDSDILEFVEIKNTEKVEGIRYNLVDPSTLLFSYLSIDFSNGLKLEDGEKLLSVCFKPKKVGTTAVNFFPSPTNNNFSTMEFITPEGELLNVAMKNGQVTVTGLSCDNITIEKNITICKGDNFGGRTEAGIYRETFPLANGCDSTDIINLEVLPVIESVQDLTICQGESFEGRTEAGIYQDTYSAMNGCDSVVTTNLTVLPIVQTSIITSICEGENLNGWTNTGLYVDTLLATTGCDSLVLTELTVLSEADSACATITSTHDAISLNLLAVYPNPANEYIILEWQASKDAIFSIYNISGQKVQSFTNLKRQRKVDVSGFKTGVYSIRILSEDKIYYAKFIKM